MKKKKDNKRDFFTASSLQTAHSMPIQWITQYMKCHVLNPGHKSFLGRRGSMCSSNHTELLVFWMVKMSTLTKKKKKHSWAPVSLSCSNSLFLRNTLLYLLSRFVIKWYNKILVLLWSYQLHAMLLLLNKGQLFSLCRKTRNRRKIFVHFYVWKAHNCTCLSINYDTVYSSLYMSVSRL